MLIVNCDDLLTQAGCTAALHVRRFSDDAEIALRADEAWLAASVIKVAIALEFYAQAEDGRVDPCTTVTLESGRRTPGPTGISLAADPVSMSLRDLCAAMLSISVNAAADAVLAAVGKDAVNGRLRRLDCRSTGGFDQVHSSGSWAKRSRMYQAVSAAARRRPLARCARLPAPVAGRGRTEARLHGLA